MGVEGLSTRDETWTADDWVVRRAYQRYLLQLDYVDRLVGEFIDHLEGIDLYNKSLIVITADHGASFRPGKTFRAVTHENYQDILRVPLFIKLPGENAGEIVDRNIESVDILPTIAEALGVYPVFKMDGRSALREFPSPRIKKRIYKTIFSKNKHWLEFDSDINALYALIDEKIKLLEEGTFNEILLKKTYSQSDHLRLKDLTLSTSSIIDVDLNDKNSFQHVDLNSNFVPVFIVGRALFRQRQRQRILLGVWINGTFRGVTRTFLPDRNSAGWLKTLLLRANSNSGRKVLNLEEIQAFGIVVPESSFRQGKNDVKIIPLEKWDRFAFKFE